VVPALSSFVDSRRVKALVCAADGCLFPVDLSWRSFAGEAMAGPSTGRARLPPTPVASAPSARPVPVRSPAVVRPDRSVVDAVGRLAGDYRLATITSWEPRRLEACLSATCLDLVIAPEHRIFLAGRDTAPGTEPGPSDFVEACERLGLGLDDVVAVQHSCTGVQSARAAGLRTIGNLHYVTARDRGPAAVDLARAGAVVVVRNWSTIARLLRCLPRGTP
jgi:hypothetical protein